MSFEPVPDRPARLVRWLRAFEDGLMILILSLMIGLSGIQIVLRNFLQGGFTWGDPLLRVLVLWIALLGAMAATRSDKHITVDILSRYLSRTGHLLSRTVTDLFTSVVSGIFAYHAGRFVWMEYQAQTIAFGAVPGWILESIIPIGFGVIAVRFLFMAFARIRSLPGQTS